MLNCSKMLATHAGCEEAHAALQRRGRDERASRALQHHGVGATGFRAMVLAKITSSYVILRYCLEEEEEEEDCLALRFLHLLRACGPAAYGL